MNAAARITRRELDAMDPAERERTITALCRRLPLGVRLYCAALDVFARGMENLARAIEGYGNRCVPPRYGSMHQLHVQPADDYVGWEAWCSCGWSGPQRVRQSEAQQDANEHAAALR